MNHTPPTISRLFHELVPLQSQGDQNRKLSELLEIPEYSGRFVLELRNHYANVKKESVSIITCTRKPHFLRNVFKNYSNQLWRNKELIIILNSDEIDMNRWKRKAETYQNVHIYQLPEETSLGHCYNFAINQASFDYIATFDDDDYYAPHYLTDLMYAFQYSNADVVGKLAYFVYFEEIDTFALRNPMQDYKYLDAHSFLDGGNKIVKRDVYNQVQYRDVTNLEDVYFSQDCMSKGFTLFSADKYNLVYYRRANKDNHTWKEKDKVVLEWQCSIIPHNAQYKSHVTL